jgi:hypothetical protein
MKGKLSREHLILTSYGIALIIIFIISVNHYFIQIKSGGHPWQTGDWVINYEAGFVRRGLIGHLLNQTHKLMNIDLIAITFLCQALFMFLMFYFNFKIVRSLLSSFPRLKIIPTLTLLYSPAGVMFCVFNLDFNFRKEIMGVSLLGYLAMKKMSNAILNRVQYLSIILFYSLFIFSWEPGIILAPFVITLLMDGHKDLKSRSNFPLSLSSSCIIIISVTCFILSIFNKGDYHHKSVICQSLLAQKSFDRNICSGAIDALAWNIDYFKHGSTLWSPKSFLGFIILLALAFAPLFYFSLFLRRRLLTIISMCFYIGFNFLAADTGRLIYILYTSFVYILFVDLKEGFEKVETSSETHPQQILTRVVKSLGLFLYFSFWYVVASGSPWHGFRFFLSIF